MGDTIDEELLEKLTEFSQKYLPYDDRDLIKNYLKEHADFGTIDYALDGEKIIGLVRYNVSDDGEIGYILDLVIHPEYRGKGLGKQFIVRALKSFPKGKWLVFKRGRRDIYKEHKISIDIVLKHNNF
jgi:ribosomal protein S18 acetylase RimI-like enzyme